MSDKDNTNITLVYMVAGISSRFKGKIKQFAKISEEGETLIERSLKQALPAGFTKIIFIVGNLTHQPFREKFGNEFNDLPVYYALQEYDSKKRNRPWGTAESACAAKHLIDCPFVLVNGDDLYGEESFKKIVEHLKNSDESATIGYKIMNVLPEEGTTNRGIFSVDDEDYLQHVEETLGISKSDLVASGLDENALCNMNIFGLQPEVLEHLSEIVEKFKQDNAEEKDAECYLPVEIGNLIKQGKLKMKVHSTPDTWLGVTNPGDEKTVQKVLEELDVLGEVENLSDSE